MMANVRGASPSVATVRALLNAGADASLLDETGLTALDHARRKLASLQLHPPEPPEQSPSLDENNQLQLDEEEQAEFDEFRRALAEMDEQAAASDTPEQPGGPEHAADAEERKSHRREFLRMWWQERLRAARRVFDDPAQVEQIIDMLEAAGETE